MTPTPTPPPGAIGAPTAIALEAEVLYQALRRQVRNELDRAPTPVRLVGVASGGMWLAERLTADLGLPEAPGIVSSVLHRDDFAQRGLSRAVQTRLPFDVTGAQVLLLDDVLHTGRTVRAVLNELFDHGRPAAVRLMVLVDRDGRELPVEAAWAAARIALPAHQSLQLAQDADGRFRFAVGPVAP